MFETYLNNRLFTLFICPLILGSLTVFSFQPFNLSAINFLVLPIFFYLLVYIKKKSKSIYRKKPFKKNLFLFGTSFGFGYFICGIFWITNSLTFDQNLKFLIPFALILIPLFLSLFFSIITLIVGQYLNYNFSSILVLSSSLAISDYIRAKILTGFPWNLWSYSFSWNTEVIQILNKIGLFAFNLLSITIFIIPAVIFFQIDLKKKIIILILPVLLIFSLYIYGNHSLNQNKSLIKSIETFNIKVVSPNFNLEYGLSLNDIEKRLKSLIRYSDAQNNKKTIIIWPEGVFSGYNFSEILVLKKIFVENFNDNHFILFGINRLNKKKNGVYNSMLIVDKNLEIVQEYKKQKLVPFGEFLPFEKILKFIGLKKITEGHGSFLKGDNQNNLIIENLNILPLICYEVIFPEFVQNSDPKTNIIINISEDGWFGNSIGPSQHFSKAIFRAVEQNTFLIRSTNRGISAIINNKGEIIKKLNPVEAGNIQLEVPLIRTNNKNKNDLIFFILLITYIFIIYFYKKNDTK